MVLTGNGPFEIYDPNSVANSYREKDDECQIQLTGKIEKDLSEGSMRLLKEKVASHKNDHNLFVISKTFANYLSDAKNNKNHLT